VAELEYPWAPGSATGIGSYPGDDPDEALRVVLGELPDLPHLPELPGRGPGADLVGRAATLLVDLPVHLQPTGWRLTDAPGRDLRRGRDLLSRDLDALEEHAATYTGPLKVQAAGVWTLAATIELRNGERVLTDPGAVRDLAGSYTEGLAAHLARVRARVPGARVVVQLDEPSLPGVLAGRVPTASGLNRIRPVEEPDAEEVLAGLFASLADAYPIVHCCAADVPYDLLRRAGARGLSIDMARTTTADDDHIGEAVDAGLGLLLGVVPGTDHGLSDPPGTVAGVRELWRRLGFPPGDLARQVVATPACGLAGASPAYARAALRACREGGRVLRDAPEA
jgi:hypothetical protein